MRKLIWLVLLLAVAGRSSRAWAQSGITAQNGRRVTCASDDMKRHLCQVDTSRGVRLTNQRSGSPCIQGQTWGYTAEVSGLTVAAVPISIWAGAVPVMDRRGRLGRSGDLLI